MSELVVNLQDPESVSLARQILDMLGNDWPVVPTTSGASASRNGGAVGGSVSASAEPTTPPWEGPDEIDRSGRSNDAARRGSAPHGPENDSKADDADPWATSASGPETPRAATSAPSVGNPAGATASGDDDDPWS